MTNEITPIVSVKNNVVVSNSRDVASYFKKEHFNVLRDIRAFDMPSDLKASYFLPVILRDQYNREIDGFDLTRAGFALLAMGFTGLRALRFKIDNIQRFNEMEATLTRSSRLSTFSRSPVCWPRPSAQRRQEATRYQPAGKLPHTLASPKRRPSRRISRTLNMNALTNITTASVVTMSSLEISALVEKRHDNVKRTIDTLVERNVIVRPQIEDEQEFDKIGRPRTVEVYKVTKRDSYVIVAQLSPEFTAALVDRWEELEERAKAPALPDFTNPAIAARAWADQVEKNMI